MIHIKIKISTNFILFLIYAHIGGMTNRRNIKIQAKKHQKGEIKSHKNLNFFSIQSHPQIQHQEIFKNIMILFHMFFHSSYVINLVTIAMKFL